jgi:hypothetical protein
MRKKNRWLAPVVAVTLGVVGYHHWVVKPMVRQAESAQVRGDRDALRAELKELNSRLAELKELEPAGRTSMPAEDAVADANLAAKTDALRADLRTVRTQLAVYRFQHLERGPALANFVAAMTGGTDLSGRPGTEFGPYLRAVPVNPFTNGDRIGDGAIGSSDWYYNETTREFRANDSREHAGH